MIKTHKELAAHIAGKSILHLNSLGKDAIASLHLLVKYSSANITSLFFKRISAHPSDEMYFNYIKRKYPSVNFITMPDPWEIGDISLGILQSPIQMLTHYNSWEHYSFDYIKVAEELGHDFISLGHSRYESVTRATSFNKNGIVQGKKIYPIGMWSKKYLFDFIKKENIKLHPCYKLTKSTYDKASYYKMRSAFIVSPEFKKNMYEIYPLLELDRYRYERLFK